MAARRVPLCVMAAVLIHVAAQQEEPRYARLSGQLHLLPDVPPGTDISGLLWKHGPYKVVEWDRGTETDHYGTFEGRTTLDLSTGNLVINSLTRADSGVYSIELNNNLQPKTYKVFIIDSVSKPIVSWRPPTCGPHLSSCLLSCDRDATGAEPVTYSWRTDEGDWKDFQKDNLPNITNDEEVWTVKTFSCKLKNPVSEEQSDPKESPFCPPRVSRGQLELLPDFPPGTIINGLLWKHGPYKVVEWDRGTETDHYGTFEGRTTLDLSTGNLVINSLTRADSGVYSIELNNNLQPKTYKVFIIDSVSKPIVSLKPLSCGPHVSDCLLSCNGDTTGAEPVTYSWRTDEGDWKDFQKDNLPNITNDEELCTVKTFSCKLKNPVSEEQSDPKESPFYCPPGDGYGWIAWIVVLAVLAAAGGVVAYLKRGEIQRLIEDRRMRIGDAHQPPDQRDTLLINHTPATDPPHTSPDSGAGMAMRPSSTEMLPAASTEIIDETNTTSSGVVKETDTPEAEVTKETTLREGGEGPQPSTNHDESTGPGESLKGEENI